MRKMAICLSKGGVGKTTTATTLAYGLGQRNKSVLLVDCDTQGQAGFFMGAKPGRGLAEVLLGEARIEDCLLEVKPNVMLLAGGRRLADATLHISKRTMGIERALLEVLQEVEGHYDYVLLDMAPGWDLLSVNALMYVQEILAPVELQMASMESLGQFFKRVADVKKYNSQLHTRYIVPTMWDRRSSESRSIYEQLRAQFPQAICEPIRASVKFFEATSKGMTIFEYAPKTPGADDYGKLVNRVSQEHI